MGYAEAHNDLLEHDCGGDPFPAWFTAQEVGQIITLAMDAQMSFTKSVGVTIENEKRKQLLENAKAWRELAERLRSGK
jgi:hypothetical protein